MKRDSRIALGFGISVSSWAQSGGDVLFLYWLLPIFNSVGSWLLVKLDAEGCPTKKLRDEGLCSLKVKSLQGKEPI